MLDVDKAQTDTTSPFFRGLGHGDFHWLSATREISIRVSHGLTKGIEHSKFIFMEVNCALDPSKFDRRYKIVITQSFMEIPSRHSQFRSESESDEFV